MRIVRTADGDVRIDPSGRVPGRGAYLCGAKECLALALKANKLGRALRCDVPQSVKTQLQEIVSNENERSGNGD